MSKHEARTSAENLAHRALLVAKWFAPSRWRQVSLDAQALTFSTLLALVPTLTLLLWAFQHLGGFLHLRYNLEAHLLNVFSSTPEVREVFGGLLEQTTQYLERGALGPMALVVFGYSFMSMMMLLDNRLNRAFGIDEAPPSGLRLLSYGLVLLIGPLPIILILGALAFVLSAPILSGFVDIGWLVEMGSPVIVATFGLTLLYKWVPRTQIQWSAAVRGALVAAIAWNLAKWLFAYYAFQAWTLKDLYGSLVTIPLFIIWLYTSWIVTLLGAQLARRLNRFDVIEDTDSPISALLVNWAQLRVALEAYRAECDDRDPSPVLIIEHLALPPALAEATLTKLRGHRLIDLDDTEHGSWTVRLGEIDPRTWLQAVELPSLETDSSIPLDQAKTLEAWLHTEQEKQPRNLATLSDVIAQLH